MNNYYKHIPEVYNTNPSTIIDENKSIAKILKITIILVLCCSFFYLFSSFIYKDYDYTTKVLYSAATLFVLILFFIETKIITKIHEHIHKITIKLLTGLNAKIIIGKGSPIKYIFNKNEDVCAKTILPGYYLNTKVTTLCLLAPFTIFLLVAILFAVTFEIDFFLFVIVFMFLIFSCSSDLYRSYLFSFKFKNVLIEFTEDNTYVYFPKGKC